MSFDEKLMVYTIIYLSFHLVTQFLGVLILGIQWKCTEWDH